MPKGTVFHADSKRRREVEFSAELRQATVTAVADLHALLSSQSVPRAQYREACEKCSLFRICLPKLTEDPDRAERAAKLLFES